MTELAILVCNFLKTLVLNLFTGALILGPCLSWLGRADGESPYNKAGAKLLTWLAPGFGLLLSLGGIYLTCIYLNFTSVYEVFQLAPSILTIATAWILLGFLCQFLALSRKSAAILKLASRPLFLAPALFFSVFLFFLSDRVTMFFHETGQTFLFSSLVQAYLYLANDPFTQAGYLHFLLASVAVGGLALGITSGSEEKYGIKIGAAIYTVATFLQAPVGGFYYNLIPLEFSRRINGSDPLASSNFLVSILCMTISFVCMWIASGSGNRRIFSAGFYTALITIFCMLYTRYDLRTLKLEAYIRPDSNQPDFTVALIIFALTILAIANPYLLFKRIKKDSST